MNFSIDIIIFSVFLIANIVIGLMAGDKVKTLRQYAIGDKNFSTGTLTSTIVATWVGGGFMFYALQNIYTSGLLFIIVSLGGTLSLFFIGQTLAVRMGEFLNNLSVAEAMGKLFGSRVQIITAVSGVLRGIGSVAIQFQVMSRILKFLFEIEGTTATLIAAGIVIFYSAFGGVRSVTITDVFQFISFSFFIPILALIVWKHIKDPAKVMETLTTNPIFSFKNVFEWNEKSLSALLLMLYYTIPGLNPAIFQRISMANDVIQVKESFTYAAIIRLFMVLSIAWIAILLVSDDPNLDPKQLVNHVIDHYAYAGLKGLVAVGVASMAMSTADSDLNAVSVLAVNDIIKPFKKDLKGSLRLVRIFSLILGLFSLLIALRTTDLLELLLLSGSFWMPIVTVPLLLAIFGFRSSSRAVLIGMTAGFIVVCCGNLLHLFKLDPLIPGMLANLVFYMGAHYVLREQGGWIGIAEKAPLLAARQSRRDAWNKLINNIKHPRIYATLKKDIPTYELIYTLFGIYIMGATYASFYTIPNSIVANYTTLYDGITHSVLLAVTIFITYPAWPATFKSDKFITFAWPLGIFYTLFVVGTMLVVMSGFHEVQIMIFLLNLVMAALLLSGPFMLLLLTAGTIVGYWIFSLYCQYNHIEYSSAALPSQFKVVYGILLLSSFLITLFRFKQKQADLEERNKHLTASFEKCGEELTEALIYREEVLNDLKEDEIELVDQSVAAYIKQIIYRTVDYIRLEVTTIDIEKLLADIKQLLRLKEFANVSNILVQKNIKEETIQADAGKIKQLLIASITYIQQHNKTNKPIIITLEKTMLGHHIGLIEDYTKNLNAIKITVSTDTAISPTQDIYMLDQINLISKVNQHKDRKQLLESARIIDAHYGYADFDHQNTHIYVLPINVREVRGKVMELLREPIAADPEETKHPMAIKLEQELLIKLQSKNVDLKIIEKALGTIKTYHAGVKRKSGEPFFTHPINVALILLGYCGDQDAIVAALLHDTLEDTSLSLPQVQARFGRTVAMIVEKLTNLEDQLRKFSLDNHEYIARLTKSEDKRIAYVKLADRLHNMRTIQGHSDINKQKKIAEETFQLFVPMAERLGLVDVAKELKDISLKVLGKKE